VKQYLDVLRDIRENGETSTDRTGVGTLRIPGAAMRFDLEKGFPILTTKKIPFRILVAELLWFIRGDTNVRTLVLQNCHIWDGNAFGQFLVKYGNTFGIMTSSAAQALIRQINNGTAEQWQKDLWKEKMEWFINLIRNDEEFARVYGDLGPVYGAQWRRWGANSRDVPIDQLCDALNLIRWNPDSRRIIISAWNPEDVPKMALPPCHCLFQFLVINGKLNLNLYQRSCDTFLGVPFNITSYAALLALVAHVMGLRPGSLFHVLGDAHIYLNHLDQVDEQLSREPRSLPKLWLNPEKIYRDDTIGTRPIDVLGSFAAEDIKLEGYESLGAIKAPMAV